MSVYQLVAIPLLFLFLLRLHGANAVSTCPLGLDAPVYRTFGSKTQYAEVKGSLTPDMIKMTGCTPDKAVAVTRHGTRYPGDDDIEHFKNCLLPKIQAAAEQVPGLETLVSFNYTWTPSDDKRLSLPGRQELQNLADVYRTALPTLFPSDASQLASSNFTFRHTYKERTRDSARSFVGELLGELMSSDSYLTSGAKVDNLLRPYKQCANLEERDDVNLEEDTFFSSDTFRSVIDRVNCRLNQSEGFLTKDDALLLGSQCFYDLSINRHLGVSPLCLLFTEEDFKLFQYADDVQKYHLASYDGVAYPDGFNLNVKDYCELYSEIHDILQANDSATTTVYFGHSETLIPFLTGLGYRHQDASFPPSYTDYVPGYELRASMWAPQAGNALFVQYSCLNGGRKMKLFLNEKDVTSTVPVTGGSYDEFLTSLNQLGDCSGRTTACAASITNGGGVTVGSNTNTDDNGTGGSSCLSSSTTLLLSIGLLFSIRLC